MKQFWIFVSATNLEVTTFVLGHKITISEKSIAKLLSYYGYGKCCFEMLAKKDRMEEIARVIFLDGKPSSNAKKLHRHLRVWFKIILGCIHHITSTNSPYYINTNHKYIFYYLSTRSKMNLPSILFKYMTEMVKETKNGSSKLRKRIPLGKLIFDILFKR